MLKKIIVGILLLSQLSIVAQNYKFGKVSKEELEEEFYPLDSTADATYLYKKRRSYFNYNQSNGFQLVTEIHQRIKIYTKEGFDYATRSVSYYNPKSGDNESVSGIKGYTFFIEDGKIVKEKVSKNGIFKEKVNEHYSKYKITLPKIKEGCVLEIKYKHISPYPTSIDDIQFQTGIPIKKLISQVEFPEYYSFNKRSKGFYSVPMKTSSKSNRIGETSFKVDIFKFEGKDIPALKNDESFVANINNYRGGMKFELSQTNFLSIGGGLKNYSTSWEDVSKKIFKSPAFGSELNKTSYFKKDLEIILATNKTVNDKLTAIFQFVKNKVKWNDFYGIYTDKGVRKAYKENVGNVADINLILTAMLRAAGLDANPVLVSSKRNVIPLFPTLKGFDYVVCSVRYPDLSYVLLDASEQYSMPNVLPVRAQNWNGRIVTKEGNSTWIKLASSKTAIEENIVMVKITDDLIIDGFIRTKFQNLNALNFRNNYNHIKEENLITKFEEKNNLEIEDFKIINKENLYKPVTRSVRFTSEDLIEEIGNKIYIEPSLFLTKRKNPFKSDERKFPVDFTTSWKDSNRISIQIPEGFTVEKLPESIAIGMPNDLGVFKYQVKQIGNKISIFSIIQFNSSVIPVIHYESLKDFYGKLVKKQTEKIVLVKE